VRCQGYVDIPELTSEMQARDKNKCGLVDMDVVSNTSRNNSTISVLSEKKIVNHSVLVKQNKQWVETKTKPNLLATFFNKVLSVIILHE